MNYGDIAFMLFSTALVFLMIPGLAFFYGGLVKRRHVLSIMMQSIAAIGIISILWIVIGYTLAFGPDIGHLIGGLDYAGLRGVGLNPKTESATIPHMLFMLYQMMFAIITPAIMTGATAERLRFPAYILLISLWSLLIYVPLTHWVWGGGWLADLGVLDFAGGIVVHISSGFSALIAALYIGKRYHKDSEQAIPHNIPYVILGGGLLWFGWFGFNGGSELAADGIAVLASTTTHLSACAGLLGWIIIEKLLHGKPTVLGAVSGMVAGLGAITPACAYVTPLAAVLIGLVSSGLCYFAVAWLKVKLGYDDALDAFGIHGIGGTWGTLAVGIFCTTALNPNGADGLFYSGSFSQVGIQLLAILATYAYCGVMTFLILKVISLITPLAATTEEQETGLDISQHGESAYPDIEGMTSDSAWNMVN
ncbi:MULTISPECIES: ammonium transporter [Dehalobacter]|jgi:Amt family ammonium transporter|uniref:Ammonium transporter n=1 Tax=Dehalobacter restrictus TaxID=55583 RepID=A0A857DDJ7_9FIRM|nr:MULTISPECIES: ammonium transporter [Dehalobacter]MCG1024175.1 ammonium transporter [Dehalobacter sp.]MDJ0305343.1 ammonium transporter [Dehalobacter sp.]OCZ49982.1 ammonia channel protein [Dehalobacter sp. TeCB1]QGZ99303.1 ammonium transporter [Dehalobacter restrictus]